MVTADEGWAMRWYQRVCQLPSAIGCDAELVIMPVRENGETLELGAYNGVHNRISVALVSLHETLATILHEVAHWAANPRHGRHHGYSWRRAFGGLVLELAGIDPLPLASRLRQGDHKTLPRQVTLDLLVSQILEQRPLLLFGLVAPSGVEISPVGSLLRA